jgi:hemerythrin-like domain-containing protein
MHAITLLDREHDEVEALFKRFERTTDRAVKERRAIADAIIDALARHAVIEEQFLYPALRERGGEEEALEALEEHHVVKWLLWELNRLDPDHERFEPKMTVLMENVRHHVKEERSELFPKVRKAFSREELEDLGILMEEARTVAPSRPHPRAPDEPPGNVIAGAFSAVLDRGLDLIGGKKDRVQRVAAKSRRKSPGRR